MIMLLNTCDSSTEPVPSQIIYPTVLTPIGRAKADSIQNSIRTNEFFSYIDEYGLFSFSGTLSRGNSNITDKDAAVKLAKDALLKYSAYSNVTDTSKLELKEATNVDPSPLNHTGWVVIFKNQKYNGIEVLNTEIIVLVNDQVRQICGHHFKEISIPDSGTVPKDKLEEILVGKKFEIMCWTKIEITITSGMILKNKIAQNVIWSEVNDCIELRVAWYVPISSTIDGNIDWNVWLDILSGEVLFYSLTFIC